MANTQRREGKELDKCSWKQLSDTDSHVLDICTRDESTLIGMYILDQTLSLLDLSCKNILSLSHSGSIFSYLYQKHKHMWINFLL